MTRAVISRAPGRREDGVRFPYGEDAEGRLRHVSDVARGLGCACLCPECREPLVAVKGSAKAHTSATTSNVPVPAPGKPLSIRLAKDAVKEVGGIGVSDAVAGHAGQSRLVADGQFLRCERVACPSDFHLGAADLAPQRPHSRRGNAPPAGSGGPGSPGSSQAGTHPRPDRGRRARPTASHRALRYDAGFFPEGPHAKVAATIAAWSASGRESAARSS